MHIGVIDLGTNSAKFAIHQVDAWGKFSKVYGHKCPTALGRDVFRRGVVSSNTAERIAAACLGFKDLARDANVERLVAVATSAFRDAQNGETLAQRLNKKVGLNIRLISGKEEANLIALGILKGDSSIPDNCTIVDIGGGSTEVIFCRNRAVISASSFNLGATRLGETLLYPTDDPPSFLAVKRLQKRVRNKFSLAATKNNWPNSATLTLVVSSGTAKAVVKLSEFLTGSENYTSSAALTEVIAILSSLSPLEIAELPGVKARRSRNLLAGAIVLSEIMKLTKAKRIIPSRCSLADGVVYSLLQGVFS